MVASPHGGVLIDRLCRGREGEERLKEAESLPSWRISKRLLSDVECIATGVYSPLQGFLGEEDYLSVRDRMRLVDGTLWSLPVTLPVEENDARRVREGDQVALRGPDGWVYAVMEVSSLYRVDRVREAEVVFGTQDLKHPGVARLFKASPLYAGGPSGCSGFPTMVLSPGTGWNRRKPGGSLSKEAGNGWWGSRHATRFTGLTNTSRRPLWRPWMASSSTRWWGRPRVMISRRGSDWRVTGRFSITIIPGSGSCSGFILRRCVMPVHGKPSFMLWSARTTGALISLSAETMREWGITTELMMRNISFPALRMRSWESRRSFLNTAFTAGVAGEWLHGRPAPILLRIM